MEQSISWDKTGTNLEVGSRLRSFRQDIAISEQCLFYNRYGDIEDSVVAQALPQGYCSPDQAAVMLGKSAKTVIRMCKSGTLPAMPVVRYGKPTYNIPEFAIQQYQLSQLGKTNKKLGQKTETSDKLDKPKLVAVKDHSELVDPWLKYCEQGMLTGKAFSFRTIDAYRIYANQVISKFGKVTPATLEKALLSVDREKAAAKDKMYKACVCFMKYLIKKKHLEPSALEQVKDLKPKNHKPVKRACLTEQQAKTLIAVSKDIEDKILVYMLLRTGMRAFEYAALTWNDIDLEERIITIQCGKGGKRRRVGISSDLYQVIIEYKANTEKAKWFQVDRFGKQLHKNGIYSRLKRLGLDAGFHCTSHMLRRTFVTVHANKGRSLVMLQKSLGHSDIKTTRSYIQTTEEETIQAMQGWD